MPWAKLYVGDARHLPLPDESVHCVVTSPPYWSLRDYGLPASIWCGDAKCNHEWRSHRIHYEPKMWDTRTGKLYPTQTVQGHDNKGGDLCVKCNAWRGSLGMEPTPELYVKHLMEAFREVWRVLRRDGTAWLNMGDSYAGSGSPGGDFRNGKGGDTYLRPYSRRGGRLKPKDLCGIPWRVAFALQAEGWWLRSDIIWAKPNPMPESVRDRPTRSHEYVFLLTKSARYYYDADAIRESHSQSSIHRVVSSPNTDSGMSFGVNGQRTARLDHVALNPLGRNRRTVWSITTEPFRLAHFATFPTKLVEPCVLAGTSQAGVCPNCGAPWTRVTRNSGTGPQRGRRKNAQIRLTRFAGQAWAQWKAENPNLILGWRPTCGCDAGDPQPAVTLDPFMGSGTVGLVAARLGRNFVGVDLKPEYVRMAEKRIGAESSASINVIVERITNGAAQTD